MRSFLHLLALLPAAFAAPTAAPAELEARDSTQLLTGKWIVRVRDGASTSLMSQILSQTNTILGGRTPNHVYHFGDFRGFSIDGADDLIQTLLSIPHITSIEQDSKVYASALTTQNNPPYGLSRISHRSKADLSQYTYDDSAGSGTFSYIIDTGILIEHHEFTGRATFGANFAEDGINTDGNGHGTHVAGTTGGTTYGVAKKTSLIAVKVLGADGSGTNAGVLAGIDWAVKDATAKGRIGKAVANLSLGGIFSQSTNDAVTAAVKAGLFLAVAAGNNGLPTFTASPASAKAVCTVGATDRNDARASFSNFGALVDIFAPGVNVTSAWKNGPDDTNTISGTSMATPHITGLGAYLLSLEGSRTPDALCERIRTLATKNVITNPGLFSPNLLAYNGNGA